MSITAHDHLEILQLIHELGYRNDHSADTMWELVTEDYASTGPMGSMNGRESLKAWGAKRITNPSQVRHVLTNTRVFEHDGQVRATSYYTAYRDSGENPAIAASVGEYHDTFAQVDGQWKFAAREVRPVFVNADAPRPDLGASK